MGEASLREAYPAEWTVRRARDAYLAENGFSVAEYEKKMTAVSFLGVAFSIPNTAKHKVAIRLHDLHHVATGFGTDIIGEGEISAWEARGGLRPLGLYVGGIVLGVGLVGLLAAPFRARAAWRASRAGSALWCKKIEYDAILELTVGELREMLGVPRAGLAVRPRRLHAYAPKEPQEPAVESPGEKIRAHQTSRARETNAVRA